MSGTGTGSRTGETKSAGAKTGEFVTEAQAANALGLSRRQLLIDIYTGRLCVCWVGGHRYVMLP